MADELILIVEDNEKNLKLARDAAAGIALAAARRPHLILLDIRLPGLDGVAALGRLRAEPRTAAILVVALTAFAMPADRARLLAAGFDGCLTKPIDVRAFPEQVRRYVERGVRGG